MEAKEKAKEIYNKMIVDFIDWTYHVPTDLNANHTIFSEAKQRALIVVDVILNDIMFWWYTPNKESTTGDMIYFITQKTYWKKVKQEIELL